MVPLPKETYGKFFEGDAYIIYSCSEYGQPGGVDVKPKRGDSTRLEQHIHFWIGQKSSQDEATVAAYKSVELDDLLSGTPIQHREVQGHESNRFRSYFKSGMRIFVRAFSQVFLAQRAKRVELNLNTVCRKLTAIRKMTITRFWAFSGQVSGSFWTNSGQVLGSIWVIWEQFRGKF